MYHRHQDTQSILVYHVYLVTQRHAVYLYFKVIHLIVVYPQDLVTQR
jgi:hypothetical protein